MGFEKGQSGNPNGRPKGIQDKRSALGVLLEPNAEDLVKKVVELAKDEDTTTLKDFFGMSLIGRVLTHGVLRNRLA